MTTAMETGACVGDPVWNGGRALLAEAMDYAAAWADDEDEEWAAGGEAAAAVRDMLAEGLAMGDEGGRR